MSNSNSQQPQRYETRTATIDDVSIIPIRDKDTNVVTDHLYQLELSDGAPITMNHEKAQTFLDNVTRNNSDAAALVGATLTDRTTSTGNVERGFFGGDPNDLAQLIGFQLTGCWEELVEGQRIELTEQSSVVKYGANVDIQVERNGTKKTIKAGQKAKVGDIHIIGASENIRVNILYAGAQGGRAPKLSLPLTTRLLLAKEEKTQLSKTRKFEFKSMMNGGATDLSKSSAVTEILQKEAEDKS